MLDRSLAPRAIPFYGSYAQFLRAMKGLKENDLPRRISSRSMSFLGEEGPRVVTGLAAMGWIDEAGNPSDDFKKLVGAFGTSDWVPVLASIIRRVYSFVPDDWDDLTAESLHDAFVSYTGRDVQVIKSAETFFLALMLECGMSMPDKLYMRAARAHTEAKRIRDDDDAPEKDSSLFSSPKPAKSQVQVLEKKNPTSKRSREWVVSQTMNLTTLIDDKDMTSKERDAVFTLLAYVQRIGGQD